MACNPSYRSTYGSHAAVMVFCVCCKTADWVPCLRARWTRDISQLLYFPASIVEFYNNHSKDETFRMKTMISKYRVTTSPRTSPGRDHELRTSFLRSQSQLLVSIFTCWLSYGKTTTDIVDYYIGHFFTYRRMWFSSPSLRGVFFYCQLNKNELPQIK